jgi:hypothetical protein
VVNLALLLAAILLIAVALRKLSRRSLGEGQRLGWAARIVLIPLLGPLAFLLAGVGRPGNQAPLGGLTHRVMVHKIYNFR